MATEIERKFVVANDTWKAHAVSESRIKQAYLSTGQNAAIRVRIAKGVARLNIKSTKNGINRAEFEYEIPLADGEEIIEVAALRPYIDKTRFLVPWHGRTWEIDVFHGENAGLVMAEIELESESEEVELPPWAGEEVSEDPRYYNANLISHPYSRW